MKMSLFSLVFQGIPEMIAITTLAYVIARAKLEWKKIIFIGVILALSAYLIRLLPITFGVHTILLICFLIFLLLRFTDVSLTKAIVGVIFSFIVLVLVEALSHIAYSNIFGLTSNSIVKNKVFMALIGIPQVGFLFFLSFIIYKVSRSFK